MSTKTIKRGGRTRPMGIIGAAISTALVPFGLIAAQKSVQKKTMKKSKKSRRTKKRSSKSKRSRKSKKSRK
jgi:F0F1-type ATP synthase assembly protein I